MEVLPPYDGSMPLDEWKAKRARDLKLMRARKSSLLKAKNAAGEPLYKLNDSGNIVRTKPLSKATKRRVIGRDKARVSCGSGAPFEVDHIVRYIDCGSSEDDNLQTLCIPCHKSKGGR